ncbi:MAG: 16S rRNA (guanine(527)-N(7))-methyltransferase RsmG [Clostridia bacterium]
MELLIKYLTQNNITPTPQILAKFEQFFELLIEWNSKFNLTTITEKDEVIIKHFADSLYGVNFLPQNAFVCDIGAGAGFPSIPLAIVRPDLNFVLVDSLNKRVNFLNEAVEKLGLTNCKSVHSRAEDLKENYFEAFDVVVSRAVAYLPTLLEYCVPYIKVNGFCLFYKAQNIEEEIGLCAKAFKALNCKVEEAHSFTILDTDYTRCIVKVVKTKSTNPIYPRGQNKPKIQPL